MTVEDAVVGNGGESPATEQSTERIAPEVCVRPANGNDLAAVLDVGHRTWPSTFGPITGPDYVEMGLAKWWTADAVIPAIRSGRTFVAEVGGHVVAMAVHGLHEDEQVLWKLYVLPEWQGGGVGRRLLEAVVDRARELGHTRLAVPVVDGNDRAMHFYERHGFRQTGREAGGSGMPDTIWLAADLAPGTSEEEDA